MVKKNKKTKNQLEYEKNIKRIKRALRRYEKIYDVKLELDIEKPKRITRNFLDKLKKIRGKKILSLANIVEVDFTDIPMGEDVAYQNLIDMINSFEDERPNAVKYVLDLLGKMPLEEVKKKAVNIPGHVVESIQYLIYYEIYGKESSSHLYNVVAYFKENVTFQDVVSVMLDEE